MADQESIGAELPIRNCLQAQPSPDRTRTTGRNINFRPDHIGDHGGVHGVFIYDALITAGAFEE